MASYNARIDIDASVDKALSKIRSIEQRISAIKKTAIEFKIERQRDVSNEIDRLGGSFKRLASITKGLTAAGGLGTLALILKDLQNVRGIGGAFSSALGPIQGLTNTLGAFTENAIQAAAAAPGLAAGLTAASVAAVAFAPQIARAAEDVLKLAKAGAQASVPLKSLLTLLGAASGTFGQQSFADTSRFIETYRQELFEASETVSELSRRKTALKANLDRFNSSSATAEKIAKRLVDVNGRLNDELREQADLLRRAAGVTVTELEASKGRNSIRTKERAELFRSEQDKEKLNIQTALAALDERGISALEQKLGLNRNILNTLSAQQRELSRPAVLGPGSSAGLIARAKARAVQEKAVRVEIQNQVNAMKALDKSSYNVQLNAKLRLGLANLIVEAVKEELAIAERQLAISKQGALLAGRFSPIGGAENIPGSPAFLAAQRRRRSEAASNALIGGAFPLLFGQGFGSALGGGLGGAAGGGLGGQFGFGLSLVGTALGSAVDTFVANVSNLADSLNDPAKTMEALEKAGIKLDDTLKLQVETLLETGRAYEAQDLVLQKINDTLGPQAVAQLLTYKEESDRLNEKYQELSTSIMSDMLPALIGFLRIINSITSVVSSESFRKNMQQFFLASPLGVGFGVTGAFLGKLGADQTTANKGKKPALSPARQREVEQRDLRTSLSTTELNIAKISLEIAGKENNLLDESVFKARQRLIAEEGLQKIAQSMLRGQFDSNAQAQIGYAQQAKLEKLKASRAKQQENLDRRTQAAGDRAAKQAERLEKREKARLEQSQKTGDALIRQLERDVALSKAKNPLERQLLEIQYAKEAVQVRINALLDAEQQAKANKLLEEKEELAVVKANVEERLRLANLSTRDLEKTGFFGGDPNQAPGFAAGFGLDVMGREKEALDEFLKKYKEVGEAAQIAGQLVTFGFRDMVAGVKSAEQVFADFLNSLADMLLKTAQQMIAQYIAIGVARMFALGGSPASAVSGVDLSKDFFSGGGQSGFPLTSIFGGGRANGGPVSGGTPYMVGERGPELFVPRSSGTIVPNNALGGGSSNVVVNVDATGSKVSGDNDQASQLGRVIGAAVQAELVKQKRPGGLLAQT